MVTVLRPVVTQRVSVFPSFTFAVVPLRVVPENVQDVVMGVGGGIVPVVNVGRVE